MAAISQTPASVLPVTTTGVTNTFDNGVAAAGVTVVAGNMLYWVDSAARTVGLADANVSGRETPIGMALGGAGPGQKLFWQTGGTINPGGTMTVAGPIYLSVTAGGITETYADIATGEKVSILGQALTAASLLLALTSQAVTKP